MTQVQKGARLLRWLNVLLRSFHLVAVILLGAGLLGAHVALGAATIGVAASGFAMLALDLWRQPAHLLEIAGVAVLVKLLIVGWMVLDESLRPFLFWFVVAGSAIFAHAPASFRHAVVFGAKSEQNLVRK